MKFKCGEDKVLGAARNLSWLIGFRTKNILDAGYLAVNRLARKCIKGLSLIFRYCPGLRAQIRFKGSIIPLLGMVFELSFSINSKKACWKAVTFGLLAVINVGKRFLQDRVLDCQIELQTNFCLSWQEAGTRQLSSSYTNGTEPAFFVSRTGCWDP